MGECQKGVGRSEAGAFHAHGASHTWARLRLGRLFQAACIWISGKTTPRGGGAETHEDSRSRNMRLKERYFFLDSNNEILIPIPQEKNHILF